MLNSKIEITIMNSSNDQDTEVRNFLLVKPN